MRALIFSSLFLVALRPPPCEVQGQPVPVADSIVTGPVSPAVARANREYAESKVVPVLPAGRIQFDRAAELKTAQLMAGYGIQMQQPNTGSPHPQNSVLYAYGSGASHADPFTFVLDPRGRIVPNQITTPVAAQVPLGGVVYLWQWSTHPAGQQACQRRIVTAKSASVLVLDQPVNQLFNRLKWFIESAAINDATENAASVVVQRNPPAVGSTVIVTSGPSLGNELAGELRRVQSVNGLTVTLDRPLRRGYASATLVRLNTTDTVTIRDCVIDQPVHPDAESVFAKFAIGWRFERCRISRLALVNCAGFQFTDCDISGRAQLTACHDCTFQNCRLQSVNFEEDCRDCTVDGCRIGPVPQQSNCIGIIVGSERITVRNSMLLGGGWQSSQLYGGGRECVFESLRMSGGSPCWLGGAGVRLTGIVSDGTISAPGASASQVKASNWP